MTLYRQKQQTSAIWPEPIESTWQLLGGDAGCEVAPKLPHLGMADILFMSSIMNLPRQKRPWGVVSWMSEVFQLSRPALYALADRVKQRLLPAVEPAVLAGVEKKGENLVVTRRRITRTVLTASLPGKMAIRPLRHVLREAFDQTRSIGWISELLTEAGRRAGHRLREIDTSPLGTVIAARDETFFNGKPLLLIIDPVTTTILLAEACPDRQAETWAAALLVAQEQGVKIGGLVEDMARMYGKSQKEAELDVPVQKDVWHIQRDGSQLLRDLERAALRATKQVIKLEKQLLKEWNEALFDEKYVSAVATEERCYDQHTALAEWVSHLVDALELVDWRSGDIRDPATNQWLLEETLAAMSDIDQPRVQKWVKTLRRHQTQLLTSLHWLATSLKPFLVQLAQVVAPDQRDSFLRTVARHWRLQQALINGHQPFRQPAQDAAAFYKLLTAHQPYQLLADNLLTLLDAACRTSSMIEGVNGLLKQFLHNHQAFRSPETLQLYLNLFVLWHNMRVFERGKRQGKSPYQLASIDTGTDDWLTLLGYPAQ
ncbi:MAG: hypothetical protein KDE51_07685 [Anaerolineales bacterium]|nr:hypothetical protein [Anaerolineales bacterium]